MGVHLSGVVAAVAAIPALALFAFRRALPLSATIIIGHISVTGFIISIASSQPFAQHTTSLLGKRRDGTISPISYLLFYPYHVGLRLKLGLQRAFSSEPAFNSIKIIPNCYLGGWPSSEQGLFPNIHPKPAILDVTCELPLRVDCTEYKVLYVWDTHSPLPHQIDEGVNFVLEHLALDQPVFIHCAHGHGRSATILAAVLLANGKAQTVSEAEKFLKRDRPKVRLNVRQRAVLSQWLESKRKVS